MSILSPNRLFVNHKAICLPTKKKIQQKLLKKPLSYNPTSHNRTSKSK